MMTELSEWANMIDTRDVLERIKELEEITNLNDDEEEELTELKSVVEQCETIVDFEYGLQLINDGYFQDYAEDFAMDVGLIKDEMSWPLNHIDWVSAADELMTDYTSIVFKGNDFWVRS